MVDSAHHEGILWTEILSYGRVYGFRADAGPPRPQRYTDIFLDLDQSNRKRRNASTSPRLGQGSEGGRNRRHAWPRGVKGHVRNLSMADG